MPIGAKSLVQVAPDVPPDVEVVDAAARIGAAAVVVLSWHDTTLLTTDVRVFVASPEDGVKPLRSRGSAIVFSAARFASAERGHVRSAS